MSSYAIWWLPSGDIADILRGVREHEANGTYPANQGTWPYPEYILETLRSMEGRAPHGTVWTTHLDPDLSQPMLGLSEFHKYLKERHNGLLVNITDYKYLRTRGVVTTPNGVFVPFNYL